MPQRKQKANTVHPPQVVVGTAETVVVGKDVQQARSITPPKKENTNPNTKMQKSCHRTPSIPPVVPTPPPIKAKFKLPSVHTAHFTRSAYDSTEEHPKTTQPPLPTSSLHHNNNNNHHHEHRLDVMFSVHYWTEFGQTLHLLGSLEELGGWLPTDANRMSWIGNGFWQLTVPLARGKAFDYKYVVVGSDGRIQRWEELKRNRSYDGFRHSLFDEWNSLPEDSFFDNLHGSYHPVVDSR